MRYAFRALLAALSETPPDDRERARSQALADAVFTLEAVRAWAEHHRDMDYHLAAAVRRDVPPGYMQAVADVLKILDAG